MVVLTGALKDEPVDNKRIVLMGRETKQKIEHLEYAQTSRIQIVPKHDKFYWLVSGLIYNL